MREMTEQEIEELLGQERIARVAFSDGAELYVVALGYVWHAGRLWGVSMEGRKSRLAAARSQVAFQIDSTLRAGIYGWQSVAGEGTFEWITDLSEARIAGKALQPTYADAPAWWQGEQAQRFAAGLMRFWRITPSSLAGRYDEPPHT
jgi:nitroimidazol reductase NimA-like FMN-containing flavoprotein (pyridoxamine 5'-phosphate oxidase superfamily)